MQFILFYWFFSTFFCFGMSWHISDYHMNQKDLLYSFLFGWILFPITLGATRVQLTEDKKDKEDYIEFK
jgi:hypothetical protein